VHQLGELRDRIAETMAYRACGLNLVVNAIILWNTVYLSRAVTFVRDQGVDIPDRLLAQVAPIPWSHIGITGDYLWNEIDQPLERYRPYAPSASIQKPSAFLSVCCGTNELGAPATHRSFTSAHGHWHDMLLDGYWFDVTSALAAAEELSTLRVSAR